MRFQLADLYTLTLREKHGYIVRQLQLKGRIDDLG